jgi:hypothetical protein
MEGTPLRSLPARAPSPVNPVHALAHVEATLPDLAAGAQRALALVDLGDTPRTHAADQLGVPEDELAALLAAGRKALRRTLAALPSDGWCERAERLISDRMDDALPAMGRRRLDAHLRGCGRCATHEKTLVQAHDALVESYMAAHAPRPRAVVARAAELRAVPEPEEPRPSLLTWRIYLAMAMMVLVVLAVLATTGVLRLP